MTTSYSRAKDYLLSYCVTYTTLEGANLELVLDCFPWKKIFKIMDCLGRKGKHSDFTCTSVLSKTLQVYKSFSCFFIYFY